MKAALPLAAVCALAISPAANAQSGPAEKLIFIFSESCMKAMPHISVIMQSAAENGLKELYRGDSRLDKGEVLSNAIGWEFEPGYTLEIASSPTTQKPVLSCAVRSEEAAAKEVEPILTRLITSEKIGIINSDDERAQTWGVLQQQRHEQTVLFSQPMMVIMIDFTPANKKGVTLRARLQMDGQGEEQRK